MKKIKLTLFFVQLLTIPFCFSSPFKKLEFVQTGKYENFSENTLEIELNYAGDVIISDKNYEILLNHRVVKIDLVYTKFKRETSFNQEELNANRILMIQDELPFINFESVDWTLVEQTEAENYNDAQKYFHGFVFHFEPKMFDEESEMMMDAFMNIEVKLPPEIDYTVFNKLCVQQFTRLAKETGGEITIVAKTNEVTKSIVNIIEESATEGLDVMIILDKTSSMADDFINITKGLNQIISSIEKIEDARFAISSFGDKNVDGNFWYDFFNFENDFNQARSFLNSIRQTHGGDYPESVYDGVYETFKEDFWRSNSKRVAILLGDAPSLIGTGTTYTEKDIVEAATAEEIHMNFYPILLSPYNNMESSISSMQPKKLVTNIYPNPTNGPVTIEVEKYEGFTVQVFNRSGVLINEEELNSNEYEYDLGDESNGLYLFRICDKNKNYDIQKVILTK